LKKRKVKPKNFKKFKELDYQVNKNARRYSEYLENLSLFENGGDKDDDFDDDLADIGADVSFYKNLFEIKMDEDH
jgi:NTP pyrophosphatase (non-canonical NTP hydrolase)